MYSRCVLLTPVWLLLLLLLLLHVLQGTLREALDSKSLPLMQETSFPDPLVVLSLAHDIAAALLHLHSEGIV